MIEIVKVIALKTVGDFSLSLRFSSGQEGVRDCADILAQGCPMVEPLRDPVMFRRLFLSFGLPSWPNGFDLDAINLHAQLRDAGLSTKADLAYSASTTFEPTVESAFSR